MLISEIYQSRQGEGRLTGTPSVFVRTSGCNLRCGFCDTPFASWSPEGQTMAPAEVLAQAQAVADGAAHVVITGGEPMLPKEITELCRLFRDADFHITIETAGTIDRKLDCDLMSISPKLANSDPTLERAGRWLKKHQLTRHQPEIVSSLIASYPYQLKFVVDTESDVGEIDAYLKTLTCQLDTSRVLLMPQGVEQTELQSREQWLEPICQQRGYTLCRRMHILWYGNQRGT